MMVGISWLITAFPMSMFSPPTPTPICQTCRVRSSLAVVQGLVAL